MGIFTVHCVSPTLLIEAAPIWNIGGLHAYTSRRCLERNFVRKTHQHFTFSAPKNKVGGSRVVRNIVTRYALPTVVIVAPIKSKHSQGNNSNFQVGEVKGNQHDEHVARQLLVDALNESRIYERFTKGREQKTPPLAHSWWTTTAIANKNKKQRLNVDNAMKLNEQKTHPEAQRW